MKKDSVVQAAMTCLLLYCALLVGCREPTSTTVLPPALEDARTVYVVGHGWHVGIVVQRADVALHVWPAAADFPEAAYLEVGWGDAEFYRAPEATLGLVLQAAFASTGSVLLVLALPVPPLAYYRSSEVVALPLTPEGVTALSQYIHDSYRRDAPGQVIRLGPGPYGHSAFYSAAGHYSLHYTCNTWAANALQVAGLAITPTMQAGPLMRQLRRLGQVLRR